LIFSIISNILVSSYLKGRNLKKYLRLDFMAPWFLLLIAGLTYGLLINDLGLYWDDFPYTWFGHVLGTTQFHKVFYNERPLLSVLYNITAPIFGENILSWQVFAIILRWLSALCVGWIVRLIWPEKKEAAFVVSLLFLVYPGFGQQWISTIYSRVFILLCFFLLSIGFMVKSLRTPPRYFVFLGLSLLFGAISLLGSEYFFGLELTRPIIIWIIISTVPESIRLRLKRGVLHWLPYFVGVMVFVIWRAWIVKSSLYEVNVTDASNGGIPGLLWNLISSMATNAYKGGIQAWIQAFSLSPVQKWDQLVNICMLVLISGEICIIAWFGWKFLGSKTDHTLASKFWDNWQIQSVILGFFMLLVGSLPVWAAKLPFDLIFPYNRFMLAMMLGSALLLTGIIYTIRYKIARIGVICVMVALSAGWHFQTAYTYRSEWRQLGTFLQQLTWRIPGMKPGTMLVAYELPFHYYSDNSLTAPINWTYAPDYKTGNLPHALFYLTVRENSVLKQLDPNINIFLKYRAVEFHGNTSDTIVLYQPETGCLRVLDEQYSGQETIPNYDSPSAKAIALSNLDRIITHPDIPALPIPNYFDQSNIKPWCYYYEKAELARQVGDYGQIVSLWEQANNNSYKPSEAAEYLPFIEGLGFQGKLEEMVLLTQSAMNQKPSIRKSICKIWGRIETTKTITIFDKSFLAEQKIELRCSQ
jgi:hypothetical protein